MAFTEAQLRQAALACLVNAQQLHEEAYLLYNHDAYARAAALAVIGTEEFAKSVAFTVAALRPDEHELLHRALRRRDSKGGQLFDHDGKHFICDAVEAALIETREGLNSSSEIGASPGAEEYFIEVFRALVRDGLENLLSSRQAAKDQKHALNAIEYGAAPSTLKELALYVKVESSGAMVLPSQVPDDQARDAILGLEYHLEQCTILSQVLEDDERWQHFAQQVLST
jgi:AbiV family abortive infection protein